jgi:hypothetical protein
MKRYGIVEVQLQHSWPRQQVEVSDQLHASAGLPPGKSLPVPNVQGAGRAPEPVRMLWTINLHPFPHSSG